ncbi:MAG: carotenoid oxygenase family protein [Pseudomonadota bacterium]
MAEPFWDHPFLKGHHAATRFEADVPDLIIRGEVPDDLAGVFYRNGSEPLYPPNEKNYHWFDGDGMVCGFYIEDGKVSMRNRWVRTPKFELEKDAGRRLFGVFGNPLTTEPEAQGVRYNTANTNAILHGGSLFACMEGAPPTRMDPRTLETLGEYHYDGSISTTFSAHPTVDWFTGEMFNFGAMLNGQDGGNTVRFNIINKHGEITKTDYFETPWLSPMHTLLLTENHVIFPVLPIECSLQRAKEGGPLVSWREDLPTLIGIMARDGNCSDIRWLEMEPRHMYHEFNAWEEDGKIIADVAAGDNTPLYPNSDGTIKAHRDTTQSLRRWTIDLTGNTNTVKEEVLNDRDIHFPRPDDRMMTRATRQTFANINLSSVDGRADGMDAVMRYDTASGEEDVYHFGPGTHCGELIFAPRVGAMEEGDGYAVTLVHRPNAKESSLAIFDANNIKAGPVAEAVVPFQVSSGFHCNYYSADSDLYKEAFVAGHA